MSKDDKKKHDEKDGPRELPQAVLREKGKLQLFLTYLNQRVAKDWLLALAYDQGRQREFGNYLRTLSGAGARNEKELRQLVTMAPALRAIWYLILLDSHRGTRIPEKANPSIACIEALSRAYDAWVERQASH